ncbi:AfsA-related hotdog domain-containing protein, partial [Streptomyces sp. NPDC059556]|uniref:AfsA-related hotdog domain-containing protein n=1 Tax=Streptomyces sp. NPDC059556 TaxID=3346863 RepID=UPI003676ECC0
LRVDTDHSTLFRRQNDHAPGMMLLEAARQAATMTTGGVFLPTAVNVSFERYAELDSPCWIEAEVVPTPDRSTTAVRVTGRQEGMPVFVCTLTSPSPELAVTGAGLDGRLAG